jgi:eukaryotic-like serine/threonine-protein kinase
MPDFDSTTREHPPRDPGSSRSSRPDSFAPDQRVVEGSGFKMASETQRLLQQRLRAATLVLVFGFGLFFVRSLALHNPESLTVMFHGLLLALLVMSLALLSSSWRPTLRELRIFEVSLFATLIVFFVAAEYVQMLRRVRQDDPTQFLAAIKSSVLWTSTLILTYAIFIPNTGKRAAKVIVPMALAPILVPWILGMIHPESYEVAIRAANVDQISEHGLFLLLGAFMAIFGTHTINTLRTEAFTARLLNQYRLGRKLGVGGMGEVYLAEHQLLKRPCAIKLIRPEHASDAHAMARFEREVRATAQLSHWNTIEIFDYGRNDDGAFYYVMEYLPGLSLDVMIRRHGPMPPARVIYLLRQACDALNEAHDVGLIHRDIKPANLFAAYRGGLHDVTKLLDFGLVKTLQGAGSIQLSQEDTVAGSPLYIAPEQVVHTQAPDRRTDIYSLGAVAYFLLVGRPPFLGETAMEVMIAHTRDPVVPPSAIRPAIPADLESVVMRCLSKKPGDRFADTARLGEALAACAEAANWSPRHAAEWWQSHRGIPEPDGYPEPAQSETKPYEPDPLAGRDGESVSDSALESAEIPRLS